MVEPSSHPLAELLSIGSLGVSLYLAWQILTLKSRVLIWRERLAFVAMTFCVAGHQLCYAYIMPSSDLSLHSTVMKCQTALLPFLFISLFLFIAYYSRQRQIHPWAIGLSIACAGLLLANMQGPLPMRISTQVSYEPALLPWGQTVYMLRGNPGGSALAALALGTGLVGWGLNRSIMMHRRGRSLAAVLLASALVLPILTLTGEWLLGSPLLYWLDASGLSLFAMTLMMSQAIIKEQIPPATGKQVNHLPSLLRQEPEHPKWDIVLDQAPACVQVLNLDGRVIKTNQASRRYWKRDLCDDDQEFLLTLLELDNLDLEIYFADLPEGEHREFATLKLDQGKQYGGLVPDRTHWLKFRAYPLRSDNGATLGVVIYHIDVTSEYHAESAIKEIARGLSDAYGSHFFDNLVLTLAKLFNAKMAFIGLQTDKDNWNQITTYSVCSDGEIMENFTYDLAATPCENVAGRQTCVYESNVQQQFPEDLILQDLGIDSYIGTPIYDPNNKPIGIMVVLDNKPLTQVKQVQEILEIFAAKAGAELQRQNAETKMRQMAYQDYLTRLPNRALLHEHLRHNLEECRTQAKGAAMYLLDLDHFKTINDTLGHDVGDEVIRGVGHRLREHLDNSIFVARMGGDEFVVVHSCEPDQEEVQARVMADRLIALMSKPLQVGDRLLNAGCSIGVVLYPDELPTHKPTELDLLRFADIALYQAKSNGRHQYVVFRSELQDKINDRIQIERGLRDALENDGLELYFQPQIRSNGDLVGVEALLRWNREDGRPTSPASFIPVAEETGLILKLGAWVFTAAFKQAAYWQTLGCCPKRISINVSAWQFAQSDFVEQLLSQLALSDVDPGRFVLELTESALLQDVPETISKLQLIRQAGFQVSLDDFGTGYSSLAYLKDLPLDELKIDKSFVDELTRGTSQPLLESMIAIGQHMQLGVIAEGIETEQQRIQLEQMGCHIFQGFLYGRPMPAEKLQQWMASSSKMHA